MKLLTKTIFALLILCVFASSAHGWSFGSPWRYFMPSRQSPQVTRSVNALRSQVVKLENLVNANRTAITYNASQSNTALILSQDLAAALIGIQSDANALSISISNLSEEISRYEQRIVDLENRPIGADVTPPTLVFANGETIGVAEAIYPYEIIIKFNPDFESVNLRPDGTIVMEHAPLNFENENCTGTAYLAAPLMSTGADEYFNTKPLKGKIVACQNGSCAHSLYYYPPKEPNVYYTTARSRYYYGICQNFSPRMAYYLKLLPNNPTITGIQQYPFSTPITYTGFDPINIISAP